LKNQALDWIFEGAWYQTLRTIRDLPVGMVADPRVATVKTVSDTKWRWDRDVGEFLGMRALQLQAKGDDGGGLEQIDIMLAHARNLQNSPGLYYSEGIPVEYHALDILDRWLEHLGPRPELLERCLAILNKHWLQAPSFSDHAKANYLVRRNSPE